MPQNTNLNVSPYFDDFNSEKGYQRVLFKPGTPIQSRELTTLQSILQNQIEKFGQHFFKEGSIVIPGQISYDSEYTCVKIDSSHLGIPVSSYIQNFVGKLIRGETSRVVAKVENFITDTESDTNNYTLYIKYQNSSDVDFTTNKFLDGENLISLQDVDYSLSTIKENTSFATSIISNSTFTGSSAKIEEGVYFVRGFFVTVPKQTIILDQYSNSPSYRVGLLVNEELAVASNNYDDLFDNARGFSNFSSPGADRLKISLSLIKKSLTDFNDENFIELMRFENGIFEKIVKSSEYNFIKDELARRTKDESGNYYVKPFTISLKESLNNLTGNSGIYNDNQLTKQGNIPSDSLACINISPGKAYVNGYEIETISSKILDIEKPRTTEKKLNEVVPFNFGKIIEVNNVFGSVPVGFGTTSQVKLYDKRTSVVGVSSGTEIGVARVYDFKLKNSEYINSQSKYEISLYDIQTYTILSLNASVTINESSLIEGKNSGAMGYTVSSASSATDLTLYQVSGSFVSGEQISINGINDGRIILSSKDYNLSDVHQLSTNIGVTGIGSFTADPVLSGVKILSNSATITNTGIVSATNSNFAAGIKIGDIVSYAKTSSILPTYNRVTSVNSSLKSFNIEPVSSVSNVCDGTLPATTIQVSNISKVSLKVLNSSDAFLYANLNNNNISSVELENSTIFFRKTYQITISGSGYNTPLPESDPNVVLSDYDEENYNLTYVNTGVVESLTDQKITVSGKTVTLSNLSVSSGLALLTVTWRKINCKVRKKTYNRCNTITIINSSSPSSGIGSTTLNDGLTYSEIYGSRVQDKEISLNVPDVENVLDIFESSNSQNPVLPFLILTGLNSNLSNLIKGEKIIGSSSKSVGVIVSSIPGSNKLEFVYLNENKFIIGEQVSTNESKISGNINFIGLGDKSIKDSFLLDDGQRSEYLDFSRIVRKSTSSFPTKKITIVYNNYTINPSDEGDFVTIDSFDKDRYSFNIPSVDGKSISDIIDMRPRVSSYTGNKSPFDYESRIFTSNTNSSEKIFAQNSSIIISYNYYLPRIDKLFLTKDGEFILSKGVPSLSPKSPNDIDLGLEVSTFYYPAYLYNVNDTSIVLTNNKRYTMKDISRLEDRISNIEYYTSLSLLETDTQNLTIRDPDTGLDRFKCGFFVDNFKSFDGGDVKNPSYKASIDISNGNLRPKHYTTSIDLILGSESLIGLNQESNSSIDLRFVNDLGTPNIKKVGDVICLNYSDVIYIQNQFATRSENVNPFNHINWNGSIELNPSSDTWTYENQPLKIYEGSSEIDQINLDDTSGFSSSDWNSWETIWTGSNSSTNNPALSNLNTNSTSTLSVKNTNNLSKNSFGIAKYNTLTNKNNSITFGNQTTTLTSSNNRQGIQFGISERTNSYTSGNTIVSRNYSPLMRSRNIEVISRRLKPNTRFYAFFDNIDVNSYFVPKLIEISMISGTFSVGETVSGSLGNKTIKFRLSSQNHKFGPYNNPTEVFNFNPYNTTNTLSNSYSSTSTILNVDTSSLESQLMSSFYGCAAVNMKLVGEQSNATAIITNLRIISDKNGDVLGSLFIPDPKSTSTSTFEAGIKSFILTTSQSNSSVNLSSDSLAETSFNSSGFIANNENSSLSLRNSKFERNKNNLNSFELRYKEGQNWIDPLSQTFEVTDTNGVFITKCDIYFKNKDNNGIPITLQIRTIETNTPSNIILPFAEKTLTPEQVITSSNGTLPTTFTFDSPVYLESGKSYAIVLISCSSLYDVWISRISETDISNSSNLSVVVSQQPLLGQLFKSQNSSTWQASPLEDLKFTLYRADFVTSPGSVRFYNPNLGIGNNQIKSLDKNCITSYSKTILVGLGKSLTGTDRNNLNPGNPITQTGNPNFSGSLKTITGSVGIGTSLTVSGVGTGFVNGSYTNVDLKSITGFGRNAKVSVQISGGVVAFATVTDGGIGYSPGDTLTFEDLSQVGNYGKDLILTIPATVGIISSFNSIIIENVQGKIDTINSFSNSIISTGTTISGAFVNSSIDINDGLHFKVVHPNHGMYSQNNIVKLSGIESDVFPESLTANYSSTSSGSAPIGVSSISIFNTFENVSVSSTNPGYVLINEEIIEYTGISGNNLIGISRGIDNTSPSNHSINDFVFKYEFNGISLRRINKEHNLLETNYDTYPTGIDDYHIKINQSESGIDRSTGNESNRPELYFKELKSGGSRNISFTNSSFGPKATQNISFNVLRPNIQIILPNSTSTESKIRTISGTSINGNEVSFIDNGFENISLLSNNLLPNTRLICSKENENSKLGNLPGKKSFTLEMTLSTSDSKVSPMIDLDRVNIITVMNRINNPVNDYSLDPKINKLVDDPNAAIYISRIVKLEQSADNLKVLFDAYRHESNDIRVLYRLLRNDTPDENQLFELFPGYLNLDENGNIINVSKNDGRSDKFIQPSNRDIDFNSYEFTAKDLPIFNGFQIKIIMTGTNQSNVPKIRDLRAIASV